MLNHHQFSCHPPLVFPLITLCFLLLHFGGTTSQLSTNDISALRSIKDSLTDIPNSAGKRFFSSWDFLAGDPCSSFIGVTCQNADPSSGILSLRVTSLTLGTGFSDSPGLAGTLSPAIANLTELTQLVLFAGIVTGPIPSQLGNLKKLRIVSLTNNRLTGPIPASLFALQNLHTLDLSYNKLTGTIPERFPVSPSLKVLILASNELSGGVPQRFWPPQLLHLDLKNNLLSGTLPKRMPSTLRYLSVSRNNMWGPLNGLQSLSELVYLDLSMNHFSGSLPPSLFRPSLSSMFLQRNNLSGTLPSSPSLSLSSSSLSSYDSGSIVDLSHNFLTGQLPTILVGVENVLLNNNRLIGVVPSDYIRSLYDGTTKTLYLQHNYISEFPMENPGPALPDSVLLCLTYNCMVPPQVGVATCPASAGSQISRPLHQCSLYKNGSSMG